MERLRSYFGYKTIQDANLCAKDAVSGAEAREDDSYVSEMVGRATCDMLMHADWALNMEVVDFVNRRKAKLKESVARALSERLKYGDSHVRSLTLTLTDTCVKNCGKDFQAYLTHPTYFGKTLVNIVTGKDSAGCSEDLKNQILALILDWKNVSPDFQDAFRTLKFTHNVSFPRSESGCVPISTPPARYATKESREEEATQAAIAAILGEAAQGEGYAPRPSPGLSVLGARDQPAGRVAGEQRAALGAQASHREAPAPAVANIQEEVDTLWNSCALLKEILEAVDTSDRSAIDAALSDELVHSILHGCREGQKEIKSKWVAQLSDETTLHRALTLNDEIDFCFTLHESLKAAAAPAERTGTAVAVGLPAGGENLYSSIFSPGQAEPAASTSRGGGNAPVVTAEPVTLAPSYPAETGEGPLELKDIVFSSGSGVGAEESRSTEQGLVFDQPDLISFDSPPVPVPAAVNGPTATPVEQREAENRSQTNAQASRMEDLLNL